MMYRLFCLPVVLALVLGTAISAQAQWIPVVAKQKELTYGTDENGSEVVIKERRGIFRRSAAGSTMKKWASVVNGQEMAPDSAVFIDANSGKHYLILHRAQSARLMQQK